jgi:CheY-like chemotaxis protein
MMNAPLRVLILENNASDTALMMQSLRVAGFRPIADSATTEPDLQGCLHPAPDVILADCNRSKVMASDAMRTLLESGRDIPFIIVSGVSEEQAAVVVQQGGVAGRDGYVSKPVSRQDLLDALATRQPPPSAGEALDLSAVFRHCDSNLDFLQELAGMIDEIAPRLVADIRDAVEEQDAVKLEHAAHRLKGSLIPFVAPAAINAAQTLEDMGHAQDLSNALDECQILNVDVQRLLGALRKVISSEALATQAGL